MKKNALAILAISFAFGLWLARSSEAQSSPQQIINCNGGVPGNDRWLLDNTNVALVVPAGRTAVISGYAATTSSVGWYLFVNDAAWAPGNSSGDADAISDDESYAVDMLDEYPVKGPATVKWSYSDDDPDNTSGPTANYVRLWGYLIDN